MKLRPTNDSFDATSPISFEQAKSLRDEAVWQQLQDVSVGFSLEEWLKTLAKSTSKDYRYGMKRLVELGLLNTQSNLQVFSLINHDSIIDQIKLIPEWSEASRQARAACYVSFTRFLSRRTQGMINRAVPSREGTAKTFFKVRDKVATNAMDRAQWSRFLEEIDSISFREGLIAKIALQGGKRISEVLGIHTKDISWDEKTISYKQTKTKGTEKFTLITYPEHIMDGLSEYLGGRSGLVFVTRNGNSISRNNVWTSFVKAGKRAGIPFQVTPHVLRASCVTYLKSQGFADSEIMAITGHASAEMVHAYDKRSIGDNISKNVTLV